MIVKFPAEPPLRLPRILLSEAAGEALVTSEWVGGSDVWLVFENGFCYLQGESQYGGGRDIEERSPEIRHCLPILVKLGLLDADVAEKYRLDLNAAQCAWQVERDRAEYERLAQRFAK